MRIADFSFYVIRAGEEVRLAERHAIDREVYAGSGLDVTFFHFAESTVDNYQPKDTHVYKSAGGFFRMPWRMLRRVRNERYDAVILHSFSFPIPAMALRWFLRGKTKVIVRHHAGQPFKNPLKRFLQKQAYAHASAFTFVSTEQGAPFVKSGIIRLPLKIHEVMEGSTNFTAGDKVAARERLQIDKGTVFLWVGRLDRNKDPLTVLRALSRLRTEWRMYMIYSTIGLLEEVREYVEQSGLAEKVVLVGEVPHSQMETWYRAADYFVAASHDEGSGYALCEAMACGCVPVASRIPSFVKMTAKGKAGFLFDPGDSDGLLAVLKSLDNSNDVTIREKVVRQFESELSHAAIGRKLAGIIRDVLRS